MKTKNLLFAGALALSTMMSPMAALIQATPVMAETVTNDTGHDYKAYKIFSGTQASSDPVLGNVEWADDVDGTGILTDLKAMEQSKYADCTSAADVAEVLADCNDAEARAFARIVAKHITTTATGIDIAAKDTSANLPAGYYLLVDQETDPGVGGVIGFSLLQLTNKGNGVTITSKTNKPSVEKKVTDETDEKANTGSDYKDSADHEIGETFQFKLTATVPSDPNMNEYSHYKVVFHDTLSKGLTKGSIVSVKVNNTVLNSDQYVTTETTDESTKVTTFTLTINDIVPHLGEGKTLAGSTVEVVYDATLNADAEVSNAEFNQQNEVYLEYSNNPNSDQEGTSYTSPDYVFVGTYELPNIKKNGTEKDHPALEGAGFKLMNNGTNKWAVITGGKLSGWADTEAGGTEIKSDAEGKFKFSGLDAGEYTLKETTTPAGFNTANDIKVNIEATHADTATTKDQVAPTVTIKHDDSVVTGDAEILNYKGSTLPETGGMGTTAIYTIGAVLTVGAAVVYVTNKRTRKE